MIAEDIVKAQSGSLSYVESAQLGNLNPYDNVSFRGNNIRFFTLIFEGLFSYDFQSQSFIPILAEEIKEEGRNQFVVNLKRNVHWHDGEIFTASDVIYTYNYIMNHSQLQTLRNYFNNSISSVEKRDENTIVINLRSHFQQDPRILMTSWIVPKHLLDGDTRARRQFSNSPIGTGPYKFVSRGLAGNASLEVNTSYHNNQASIATIRMEELPDPDSAFMRVNSMNSDLLIDLKSYQVGQVRDTHRLEPFRAYGIHAIGFNFRNNTFRDDSVRRAMTHGFNRFRALESWFDGRGTVIGGPFSPGAPFFDPNLRPLEFNPEKSRTLLREAGYTDLNGDGFLQHSNGERLGFALLVNHDIQESSQDMVFVIEQFQSEMKSIGIEINTRYEVQDNYDRILFIEWDYDLVLLEWTFDPTYDISQLFHSDNIGPGGNNVIAYDNQLITELFNEFRNTQNSLRRIEIMHTIQNIIARDAPYIFMFNIKRNAMISNKYSGTTIDPYNFFGYINEWYIIPGFD